MQENRYDSKYCYPNSNVLVNKLGITSPEELFQAEIQFTSARLYELQEKPIRGKFDFLHLKKIHRYIFQDLYLWAGKIRTVDIGKGNLFCRVQNIPAYAETVFENYYASCRSVMEDKNKFISTLVSNYADVNALHPFREGNGRSQREFARELCLACGYVFDLSHTTHKEMLEASILSFDRGDNTKLEKIFRKTVVPLNEYVEKPDSILNILSVDDINVNEYIETYEYYEPQ